MNKLMGFKNKQMLCMWDRKSCKTFPQRKKISWIYSRNQFPKIPNIYGRKNK